MTFQKPEVKFWGDSFSFLIWTFTKREMPKSILSFKISDSLRVFYFVVMKISHFFTNLTLLVCSIWRRNLKKCFPFPICGAVAITNVCPLYQPLWDVLLISQGLLMSVILNACIYYYREFKIMWYIDYCVLLSTFAVNFTHFLNFMVFCYIFHLNQSLLTIFCQRVSVWILVIHEGQKY